MCIVLLTVTLFVGISPIVRLALVALTSAKTVFAVTLTIILKKKIFLNGHKEETLLVKRQ